MSTATRNRSRAPRTPFASAPQLQYIRDLLNSREVTEAVATGVLFLVEVTERAAEGKVREDDPAPLDKAKASTWIKTLDEMKRKSGQARVESEGVFEYDGSVYLVTTSKAGRLYARVYADPNGETEVARWHEPRSVKLTYAPGMMGKLREAHRASTERCHELSRLTATCVRCGAQLTDPESVARGMGPTCAAK
jgi:hypothetical protein